MKKAKQGQRTRKSSNADKETRDFRHVMLSLDEEIVQALRETYDEDKMRETGQREVYRRAVAEHLDYLVATLNKEGFIVAPTGKRQRRRIDESTWRELGKAEEQTGIGRPALLRCCVRRMLLGIGKARGKAKQRGRTDNWPLPQRGKRTIVRLRSAEGRHSMDTGYSLGVLILATKKARKLTFIRLAELIEQQGFPVPERNLRRWARGEHLPRRSNEILVRQAIEKIRTTNPKRNVKGAGAGPRIFEL